MSTQTTTTQKGPLPLSVSVTGHRDLRPEDLTALKEKLRDVFREITARYPHTPLLLLSPLAEGADRLAARVGLEFGARLIVPLPLPRDLYEADFENAESRAEFSELLEKADQWFVLPCLPGNTRENTSIAGECRNQQYAFVGAYVARHSQIFFALWDGIQTEHGEKMGGTAEVVRFKLEGVPEPYASQDPLDMVSTGPVYHIVTPRRRNAQLPAEPLSRRELFPEGSDASSYDRIYERMELFNRDAVAHSAMLGEASQQSLAYLFPAQPKEGPPVADSLPPTMRSTLKSYAIADALAIYFAQLTSKTLDRVFASVLVAALSFNLFHSLPHPHPPGHESAGAGGHAQLVVPEVLAPAAAESPKAESSKAAAPHDDHAPAAKSGAHSEAGHAATSSSAAHGSTAHPEAKGHPPTGGHADSHAGGHESAAGGHESAAGAHASAAAGHGESSGILGLVPWFLLLYLAVIVFNVILHRRAEHNDYQNKYQDYRALAEGLRIQIFWRMAGLSDSVAEHYLGKQRGELEWIRNALRAWNIDSDAGSTTAVTDSQQLKAGLMAVRANWIVDQKKYYAKKARHEHEELENDEKYIQRLLAASVTLTVLLAIILTLPLVISVPFLDALKHWIESPWVHSAVMIAIVMLAVRAGLLHTYNQQKARSEHAKQFGRMSVLFDTADRRLEVLLKTDNIPEAQNLVRELGREALLENGDWVLLHRERPLEVPHAA